MSRLIGTATVEDGAWVFRPDSGEYEIVIRPEGIYSPGSSIGGWICREVHPYRGALMIRVVAREKGAWRNGERWQLPAAGEWLKLGPVRLAASAGAAHRGLTHRHVVPTDPLEAWRLRAGLPQAAIIQMAAGATLRETFGGKCWRSCATGHGTRTDLDHTDGRVEELHYWADERMTEWGEPYSDSREVEVAGASYAIETFTSRGDRAGRPSRVWVWPGCAREILAKKCTELSGLR